MTVARDSKNRDLHCISEDSNQPPSMGSSIKSYPYPSSKIDVRSFVRDNLFENNYEQWRQQMHDLIKKEGLLGFIDGTIKAPKKEIANQNYISWKRSDDLLKKWIRTTLARDIRVEVKLVRSAKALWTKLEKWFRNKTTITSMAASSASNSSSAAVDTVTEYPYPVSKFVKKSLSVSGNNYSEWRQQMYGLINSEGLVGFVNGAIDTQAESITVSGGGDHNRGKEIENDKLLQEWIKTTVAEDILKEVVAGRTAKVMWTELEKIFGYYVPLHKATIEDNWEKANEFIQEEPDIAIRAGITEYSETMLIVAVKSKRRNNFVKKLMELMSPEDLALGDTRKRTALHRAAGAGNIEAAKLLVNKNPYLPNAQTYDKRIPLFFAASRGHREMVLYLLCVTIDAKPNNTSHLFRFLSHSLSNANHLLPYSQAQKLMEDGTRMGIAERRWNPTPFEGEIGFQTLNQLTISGLYDIALALLQDKPELACFIPKEEKDLPNFHSLMAIARKPSSFQSGTSFNFFQNLIYSGVPLKLEKLENIVDHNRRRDIENPANGFIYGVTDVKKRLHSIFWEVAVNFVPYIYQIREKKMVHHQALELVKFICNEIVKSNFSNASKLFLLPLFQATSVGIHEIVEAILGSYPDAIYLQNHKYQSIFHQAIMCRCENVFNLIHQVEDSKTMFLTLWDESKNNALHLAGYLSPQQQLYLKAGAALQMQRELQWFKEVGTHVVPRNKEERNNDGKTPAEVFTDTHKELVKEGERWMKDTANACSIVATLIATVVFAAAITVPGGNNGDNGQPIFSTKGAFIIFSIFDAFALFSSITSVLLFLAILTSRYGEDDFLVILPRRLIFGLLTLFLSILSTMIAFGATLYLVLGNSYERWIIIPVFVLSCIPVTLFVFLQFPLLVDMFKSTYGSIFVKQSGGMLH